MSDLEANLVQRAKAGDQEAFSQIYEENHQKIFSYIYYRVNDIHLAEDLASEVFIRLVRSIGTYTYKGKPIVAWLYTVAGNIVRDHFRKAKRVQLVPIEDREVVSDEDPTEPLDLSMLSDDLVDALNHLTDEQALVIILKFVEGKKNAEVAAVMGKEEGSIKSLQHRALRSLKRYLQNSANPEYSNATNNDE